MLIETHEQGYYSFEKKGKNLRTHTSVYLCSYVKAANQVWNFAYWKHLPKQINAWQMENTQMKKVQSITLGNLRRSQLTIYSFEQLSADNYFCKEAPLCMFDRVLQ